MVQPGKTKKVSSRRVGSESSATRAVILDTTEQLMINEGYAAVSTRRVAAEAALTAPLVHYYFPSTDDLFIEVYRRAAERVYARLDEALASERPLHALWEFASDSSRTTLAVEFMALANHRKTLQNELKQYTEQARRKQAEAIRHVQFSLASTADAWSPLAMALLIVGVGRALVMEGSVGISLGHDEARAHVEQWLALREPLPEKRG